MELLKFLGFMVYVTAIFFLPDTWGLITTFVLIGALYCFAHRLDYGKVLREVKLILPFMLLTFVLNVWLDDFRTACFMLMKLATVYVATLIYAQTTRTLGFVRVLGIIFEPLEKVGIKTDEILLMVCISLALIPIIQRDTKEVAMALRAKGMDLNLRNAHWVLVRLGSQWLRQANELDDALKAKGMG